ncbi:dipeptide/oligopeptide/nickel ABC transporter permease/ATP-binding protein (plasmid) [Nocardioides sp. R1-1]|uniref:dipeptide/oligopeptide/nickel ABC transporter permease/ATP-binding protein n=1 Tax=Nocardioides sp. R1-1 TaxID=3383502 RepID=UPI0038D1096F
MTDDTTALAGRPTKFRWNFSLVAGLAMAVALVMLAVAAPFVLGDRASTLTDGANLPASADHPLGTDGLGRDMLARSLVAVRLTLIMTVAACALSVAGGVIIGAGLWAAPRRIREAGLRLVEIAVSYPSLLIALIVAAVLGPGTTSAVMAIGVAGIPAFARLSANMAASLTQRDFVSTAQLLGVSRARLVRAHLLPNMAEPLLVMTAAQFAIALMEMSGLSFVGLGVQSPDYDFGRLLVDGLGAIYTRPIQVVGPAVMIILTGLAGMLIGDGLAAAFNVRSARFGRRKRSRRSADALRAGIAGPAALTPVAGHGPSLPRDGELLVDVRDLVVRREDGHELVKGVSFGIRPGEILGVVGESGSGKSLTAMSLSRLLPESLRADATTMRIGEHDVRRPVDARTMAGLVGNVYQDPGTTFNPALRLGAQLSEVLRRHRGLSRREARAKVVQALQTVHISEAERRIRQHPHELSGGMRQRAMIASTVMVEPQLIIADEPTTALDVTVQAEVLREFKRVNERTGAAMLFVSHDLGVVGELCDRVLVMTDGRVVEELTAAQLRSGSAEHPYTRKLLAATPVLPARENAHLPTGEEERVDA